MTTLFDLFDQQPHIRSDALALSMRIGLREERWSYAEYRQAVDHVASQFLNKHGLVRGNRVLFQAPNAPRSAIALHAIMRAGLVAVPLDAGATEGFVAEVAHTTEARAIVCPEAAREMSQPRQIPLEILETTGEDCPDFRPSAEDVAEIVFTSGTTGAPKGVVLSHRNLAANVSSILSIVPSGEDLRLLSVLPLSHMFEQSVGLASPLVLGGSVHFAPGRSSVAIRKALKRHRITCMVVVPQLLDIMMASIERQARERGGWPSWDQAMVVARRLPVAARRKLFRKVIDGLGGHLSFCMSGGAALPPALNESWEAIGVRILQGYGATECSPVIASNAMQNRSSDGVGFPVSGVNVRMAESGELQVKGDNVFSGYWHEDEATREAFTEDGWYRTGDLAEKASDGRLTLRGRLKEMITLPSGMNAYPEDIETVLLCCDGIEDCAVVGLPDAQGNPQVSAVVCSGLDDKALAEVIRSANASLAPHQAIMRHSRWPAERLPRTPLLKLKRAEIRETLLSQEESNPKPQPAPESADALKGIVAAICRLPPGEISETADIRDDLGFDSLMIVELAGALETELGVVVEEARLAEIRSFADLRRIVGAPPATTARGPASEWPLSRAAIANRRFVQDAVVFPGHRFLASRFEVQGVSGIQDAQGPVLLAANHSSHVDTLSILRAMPRNLRRRTAVAAAADYFFENALTAPATKLALNVFPFSRGGNIRDSLEHCGDLVDRGWSILIYPEGTRSATGTLLPFKPGIGLLATGLGVPVVPVGVTGGETILAKGQRFPRRGKTRVVFGAPMNFEAAEPQRDVTKRLEDAVADLMGVGRETRLAESARKEHA